MAPSTSAISTARFTPLLSTPARRGGRSRRRRPGFHRVPRCRLSWPFRRHHFWLEQRQPYRRHSWSWATTPAWCGPSSGRPEGCDGNTRPPVKSPVAPRSCPRQPADRECSSARRMRRSPASPWPTARCSGSIRSPTRSAARPPWRKPPPATASSSRDATASCTCSMRTAATRQLPCQSTARRAPRPRRPATKSSSAPKAGLSSRSISSRQTWPGGHRPRPTASPTDRAPRSQTTS